MPRLFCQQEGCSLANSVTRSAAGSSRGSADPAVGLLLSLRLIPLPAVRISPILIGLINPLFSGFAFFALPTIQQVFKRGFAERRIEAERLEIEAGGAGE